MSHAAIADYLKNTPADQIDSGALGYICNLAEVSKVAPNMAKAIVQELADLLAYLKSKPNR